MANIVLWISARFDFHDVAVTTRISRIYHYFWVRRLGFGELSSSIGSGCSLLAAKLAMNSLKRRGELLAVEGQLGKGLKRMLLAEEF